MNDETAQPSDAPTEEALRANWLAAFLAWDGLRTRLGDTAATYVAAAVELKRAKQEDSADRVMDEAVRRFPDNIDLAVRHATNALNRELWNVALERWQGVVVRFPNNGVGYLGAARLLRRDPARLADADTLLELAAARFPFRQDVWQEFAGVAHDRKNLPDALQRYQTMRERFPDMPAGHRGTALVLRDMERFDEAETVLSESIDRFPDDPQWLVERAWVANRRQDWEETVRRWEAVRLADPKNRASYWMAGAILMNMLGRFEEAEALLGQWEVLFPDHIEMAMDHARVAERLEDWPEAARRWEALHTRQPNNAAIASSAERARTKAASV